ncbi:MAG: PorV/PorQ family protein [Bacteroidia bacterium]|nr:PorV/PorQ family protein [Bacteroidia bacterium]MCZ2277626.1 PorV/PorQ family protein [Bacteroidia bacterium]
MLRITFFLFYFCFTLLYAQAQTAAPKYSNEFLSIGVGARALGMGGAQVAGVQDATSAFWNPAGLCQSKGDLQIALMHNEYFAGIAKFDYATVAAPVDATRTVAVSLMRFAVDDIIDSTDLIDASGNVNYDKLKTFSAADYAFLFSYSAKTAITGLRYGGNFKIVHRKAGKFASAWGFGLDAGIQYDKGKWRLGAMGKDITSTFNAWSFNTSELEDVFIQTGNEIPQNGLEITLPKLILGVGYHIQAGTRFSFQPELNLDITFDGKRNVLLKSDPISADPKIGIEAGYNNFLFLRAGINNIQQTIDFDGSKSTLLQPSMGVGLKLRNLTIDYALTNISSSGGILYSNVFSLKLDIFKHDRND